MDGHAAPQDILTRWLEHLKQQGKSPHTLAAYRRAVEHFAAWNAATCHAPLDAGAIIPRDVQDWKAWQQSVEESMAKGAGIREQSEVLLASSLVRPALIPDVKIPVQPSCPILPCSP